ncbi:MAG TPA: hypothetical protein DD640_02910 [Clostridiales bacterium]|nr:hypothetical protein [Clostridiales bacterium]
MNVGPLYLDLFSFFSDLGTMQIILFVVGLLLMAVEIFVPGFGIAGGAGLVLLIIAIIMTAKTTAAALIMILILLALAALVLWVVLRSAKKGRLSRILVLGAAARHENGYSSTADTSDLVGKTGTAVTVLRPSGIGDFGGHRLDVVTDGGYLASGTPIIIIRTEGRRIVVAPVKPEDLPEVQAGKES